LDIKRSVACGNKRFTEFSDLARLPILDVDKGTLDRFCTPFSLAQIHGHPLA